ncbi:MAG: EAL domain-containing protein [Microcoleus vaginatus WJT46-NPBG5]|nr:EAL domain-containing protein [Microcoleus vaginatus WJT46-NPBG5]
MKEPPLNVLVIKDHLEDACFIKNALANYAGVHVELLDIHQGEIAIERLAKGGIDVILLDVCLPTMWELSYRLKTHAHALKIPIIMLTEKNEGQNFLNPSEIDTQACILPYPFNGGELIHSIDCAITRQQLLTEIEEQALQLELAEKRARKFEVLYELSRQLAYTLNYEELVRRMLAHLYRAVPHDISASILSAGDLCHFFMQPTCQIEPAIHEQIQKRLFKTFTRMRGNKTQGEEQSCAIITLHSDTFDATRKPLSALGSSFQVPIIDADNNEVVGLLFVGAQAEGAFTEDQVRLLYTVATQASLSIQRLRTLLAAEQQHLESLVENLPEGVLLLDAGRRIVLANPTARKYLALLTTQSVGDALTHIGTQSLEVLLQPNPKEISCHEVVLEGVTRSVFEIVAQPLSVKAGSQASDWVLVIRDVTERQQAEEISRLRDRAIAASSNGIVIVDTRLPDLPVIYVNPAFERITGYSGAEVIGHNCRFLQGNDNNQPALEEMRAALKEGKSTSVVLRNYRKDGSRFWNELHISPIYDNSGTLTHFVGIQTDITERKQVEEQLLHNAFYDALTNLPNRALFMERLERAFERAKRSENYLFAVLFLDLDRFKNVNDSLGHLAGDKMLIESAKRLEASLRSGDTVARLGGDEFAILLEDIKGVGEAIHVAERIHKELTLPLKLDTDEVFTTVSIGIALSSTGYNQPEDILRDADIAMYRAKALGKARHEVFDKNMHARAVALLQLETDLRRAIERQEFEVYYQPIVSLATEEITGFEALVRWQHPDRGVISPGEFIPLAEETGLINLIGWGVLRKACYQLRAWQLQFPNHRSLSISVNLSGKQFSQPNLVEQIAKILKETDLDASNLKLEITESAIMENVESASAMLWKLRKLGIQLYMDDFGTGYSSLSYLRRFPIDTLKIDRSFVKQMMVDDESLEIVRTIVLLAKNLGMNAIAEGVETQEQLTQLKALQCEFGQGYFFSKPLEAERVSLNL